MQTAFVCSSALCLCHLFNVLTRHCATCTVYGKWHGWRVTAVCSLLTPVSDDCILLTLEHSLLVGRAAVLETGPLPQQDHKSGTVCHPISDYVGCHTASSGGY